MDHDPTGRESDRAPVIDQTPEQRARVLAAPILSFDLPAELDHLRLQDVYRNGQPSGRTLLKEPDLRIVLIALKTGGRLEEHHASGPISVQGIEGRLRLRLPEGGIELAPGQLVTLESGIRHDVEAMEDSAFLLTIGRTTYQNVSDHHEHKG